MTSEDRYNLNMLNLQICKTSRQPSKKKEKAKEATA
jgi:hypothetical protein